MTEFRRTHFIFGKHSTIHFSHQRHEQLAVSGKLGGRQQQNNGALKNQMTNFRIGTGLPKHQQYATTYKTITGEARGWNARKQQIGEVKAKLTSVQLGRGNQFGFATTNQRLFSGRDPKEAIVPPNKDFVASIKTHHFDVGNNRPKSLFELKKHYLSEANFSYNHKGNAA